MRTPTIVLTLLVILFGGMVAPSLAQPESNPGSDTAQTAFLISPREYNINFSSLDTVEVKFELTNLYEEDLVFSLLMDEDELNKANSQGIEIVSIIDGARVDLLESEADLTVAGGGEVQITLELTPTKQEDYRIISTLTLQQLESERRLTDDSYDLVLNIESSLVSGQQQFLIDVAVVTVISIAAIAGIILYTTRKRK